MVRGAIGCIGKVMLLMTFLPALAAASCPKTGSAARSNAAATDDAARGAGATPSAELAGIAGRPWINHRFVYEFSPEVAAEPSRVSTFESVCSQLLGSTALNCSPRSAAPEDPDYVYVIDGGHDFSHVGRQGGCQVLSIVTWSNPIVVAHEIKHALGWAHEQQHPDRDRYLDVDFDAIEPVHRAAFEVRNLGNEGPYDPDSMMHFFPVDFARPGAVAFRLKAGQETGPVYPGQRDHLSATDLAEIRAVYGVAAE